MTLLDQDGIPKDATGALTVTGKSLDGSAVPLGTTQSLGEGEVSVTIAAADIPQPDLVVLTATDEDGAVNETAVEVVGGYYFSITEARKMDGALQQMAKYPDEDVIRCRQEVEDEFERISWQAFVPRADRFVLSGDGSAEILLSVYHLRSVRSISVGGVPFTSDQLAGVTVDPIGLVTSQYGPFLIGTQNVTMIAEHGMSIVPADLKAAMVRRLRERLNSPNSGMNERATSMSADGICQPG